MMMSSDGTSAKFEESSESANSTSTNTTSTIQTSTTTNNCFPSDTSHQTPLRLNESMQSSPHPPLSCEMHNNNSFSSNNNNNNNNITATSNSSSNCNDINSTKDDDNDTISPPVAKTKAYHLKDETIYKLVDHSVGAIALDCGYHKAHQSSLDILTDVCCDYFKKIATLLRIAHDTEEWRDADSDFVDSLERVFHQTNIPSAANLHQFVCKMEAFKRHQKNSQTCNK